MEVTEKITLDMLTKEGVSVLRQKFININDVEVQVGENVRNAFTNCDCLLYTSPSPRDA